MSKYKATTIENSKSVTAFVRRVPDHQKQEDSFALIEIMKKQSGFPPKMWGPGIIGFGRYHYQYESGHEGDAPLIGFSPRKTAIVLYIPNFEKKENMLKEFGKHKTGKACIYFKKLEDINLEILKKMIPISIKFMKAKYK
jgi:hypothetical protein